MSVMQPLPATMFNLSLGASAKFEDQSQSKLGRDSATIANRFSFKSSIVRLSF